MERESRNLSIFTLVTNPTAFISHKIKENSEMPAILGALIVSFITAAVTCLPQVLLAGEERDFVIARMFINKSLACVALFLLMTWLLAYLGRYFKGLGTAKTLRRAHGAVLLHLAMLYLPCLVLVFGGFYTGQLSLMLIGQLAMLGCAFWVAMLSIRATALAHNFNIWRARALHTAATVPLVLIMICFTKV